MRKNGYITLLSVLIVGAVGIAITVSIVLLGLGSARNALVFQQMQQAKMLASACIEEALEQVRITSTFAGGGTLTLAAGSCTYMVASQGGESRTLNATSTVGAIVRKAQVVITAINPLMVVASWQEIP